ncbi:MAG: alcohol dehydrogenase catalytic domain-containing protein [Candidatus Aminicenantaceae bacterium]
MKALLRERGKLTVRDVSKPLPLDDEALVKVIKAGICSTDLELAKGYMEFEGILGHEFVGRVVKTRESTWAGKRVVGSINLTCGKCPFCLEGMEKHCQSRKVLGISGKHGAFAEFLTLPLANLYPLPSNISDSTAVFIEPLAASLEIFEQVKIEQNDSVLVLGDGKLGLLIAQVMKLKTNNVSCLGKYERKLEILKEKGIKTYSSRRETGGMFDVLVEATGNERGLQEALSWIKPKGKIVLKSTFKGFARVDISKIVVDEIQLIGSRCGPFQKAIDVLSKELIEVDRMIDGDFPLEKAQEALVMAQKPGIMKILISP